MINDDKPMLRIEAEKVMVYGTPWNGGHHLSRNASAPLKAVICLNRGPVNRIQAMSHTEAFPVLASHIYNSGEPDTRRKVAALEMELMERGSFYRLSCNMHPEAALTAWQSMNEDVTRQ
ncbi:MAG: hypothetical protein IKP86_10985 [Anaerolineaceae bacterium]|nr:hypothetical protein [Anaerolineaceae bacterium]